MERRVQVEFSSNDEKFSQQLNEAISTQQMFDILIIINIISASKGFQLISQKWFQSLILSHNNVTGIILRIKGTIRDDLPANLDLIFKTPFLIAFHSLIGEHESKTYWKSSENNSFYSLDIDNDFIEVINFFCHGFIIDEIKRGRTGVLENFRHKNKIRLQEVGDNQGRNLLTLAVSKNQLLVIKNLLKYEFYPDDAIDVAWKIFKEVENDNEEKKDFNEIILNLLNANSRLPINFEYETASKEIKHFVDSCESLHRDVDENNFDALRLKLEAEPNLIHFYNRDSESVLAYSLRTRKFKIFEFLDKEITTGCHEDLDEVYENMYIKECRMLRDQHKINAKEFPETHIFILRSKSNIGNNDRRVHQNWKFIDEAFDVLNRNEYCRKILKVAAEFKKLKIYFDFKHDTTYYLDPATSIYSKGIIYEGGSIFIGAKYLKDDEKKFLVFGVLAHELCHLAVYMAFMNCNFDPFPVGESIIRTTFINQVMIQCKEREESENIVANVFKSYAKDVQDSEMIVTVPQMLMQYVNNSTKIEELEGFYEKLFRYSREIVEPELDKALPVLKILGDEEKVIKFTDLTESMKTKVLHSKINFQGSETTFYQLIGNDLDVLNLLTSGNLRRVLVKHGELEYSSICELNLKYGMIERNFIEAKIDERLKLMELNTYVEESKKFVKSLESINNSEIFLLADHAGTGKTTSFKDLALKLKNANKNFWVSYVNLRSYGAEFDKIKSSTGKLKFDDICQILLNIVDQESEIEEKLFEKLFLSGKTILLFDGFDEICPKYTKIVMEIFELITTNKVKNQIYISTRPHYVDKLVELLKVPVHKFVGTTHFERVDMINRILDFHMITADQGNLRILQIVNMYIYGFFTTDKNTYEILIENPMMIQMITELFIENSIQIDDINICRLYIKMIEKQKEKVGSKIPNSERDPTGKLSVWDVHKILSIILIFGDDFENELGFKIEELSIMKKWKKEKKNWTSDMIQRYGFVNVDFDAKNLRNSIDFVHRTYAEFFVAQFLMEFVFDDNDEISEIEVKRKFKILDLTLNDKLNFKAILDFMWKYFDVFPENTKFDEIIEHLILKRIDEFHENFIKNSNDDDLFGKFANYGKFLSKYENLSSRLWQINKDPNILQIFICKNYKNYIYISKAAELSFGSNWHEKFNKNDAKLITDENLNTMKGMSYNDFLFNSDKNLLKLYDLVQKSFDIDCKEIFKENFNINELNSIGAQIEIIFIMSSSFDKTKNIQKYLNELNYKQITLDTLMIIFEKVETALNHDHNLIREFLFQHQKLAIFETLDTQNLNLITAIKDFFAKYKVTRNIDTSDINNMNKVSEKIEL